MCFFEVSTAFPFRLNVLPALSETLFFLAAVFTGNAAYLTAPVLNMILLSPAIFPVVPSMK